MGFLVSKDAIRDGESITQGFARQVGLADDHAMVKTMVYDVDKAGEALPVFILQHGDKKIDTKKLAVVLGAKRDHVKPTKPDRATELTGYVFGGTTVFGSKAPLDIYAEQTIFDLPTVFVNGGSTSLCICMKLEDFEKSVGQCTRVQVAAVG